MRCSPRSEEHLRADVWHLRGDGQRVHGRLGRAWTLLRADTVTSGALQEDEAVLAVAKLAKVNRLEALHGGVRVAVVAVAVAAQVAAVVEQLGVFAAHYWKGKKEKW